MNACQFAVVFLQNCSLASVPNILCNFPSPDFSHRCHTQTRVGILPDTY